MKFTRVRALALALMIGCVPALAVAANELPTIGGPQGPVTAGASALIGYDAITKAPCVVGKTATCNLATSGGATTTPVNLSSSGTLEIVPASGTTAISVTGGLIYPGGTVNLTFVSGHGTNCGTGQATLSGLLPLKDQGAFIVGNGGPGPAMVAPAGEAICIAISANIQVGGWLTWKRN